MSFPDVFYTIDIAFAVLVFLVAMSGLCRGLSGELALILTLAFLLCGFYFFYPMLTRLVVQRLGDDFSIAMIRGTVAVVLGVGILVLSFPMHLLLRKIMKISIGVLSDKILGAMAGLLRGILIGVMIFVALSFVPSVKFRTYLSEKSVVGGWTNEFLTPWVLSNLHYIKSSEPKEATEEKPESEVSAGKSD